MASADQRGWWLTKGLLLVAVAAGLTSNLVPPVGWKPAFQALAGAVLWAVCVFGWIKTARVRVVTLMGTALLSAWALFALRIPASIVFMTLGVSSVVAIGRAQREALARKA